MLGKTHLLAALVVGIFVIEYLPIPNPILFLVLFCFATMLPDIDDPHSKLGKRTRPLSNIIGLVFGHRGFWHSIWIPLAILGVSWYFGYLFIGYTVMGGFVLHLMVDTLTLGGIRWFGPFGKKTRGFMPTGGYTESIIYVVLLVILFWKLASYF